MKMTKKDIKYGLLKTWVTQSVPVMFGNSTPGRVATYLGGMLWIQNSISVPLCSFYYHN